MGSQERKKNLKEQKGKMDLTLQGNKFCNRQN